MIAIGLVIMCNVKYGSKIVKLQVQNWKVVCVAPFKIRDLMSESLATSDVVQNLFLHEPYNLKYIQVLIIYMLLLKYSISSGFFCKTSVEMRDAVLSLI